MTARADALQQSAAAASELAAVARRWHDTLSATFPMTFPAPMVPPWNEQQLNDVVQLATTLGADAEANAQAARHSLLALTRLCNAAARDDNVARHRLAEYEQHFNLAAGHLRVLESIAIGLPNTPSRRQPWWRTLFGLR